MDIRDICRYLTDNDGFVITTHEAPDGDGLGAEYALCSTLLSMGKEVIILNSDSHEVKYDFIDEKKLIRTVSTVKNSPETLSGKTLIILDTEPSNIGASGHFLRSSCASVIVIDHHTPPDEPWENAWLEPGASSTCEMIFRVIEALSQAITQDVARALYTGIVYDTGSFIYPKTQAETFHIAEKLVEAGAVPNEVFTGLFQNKSTGALLLHSLVSSTLVLYMNNQVAVQIMARETLIASGASYEESQEIINFPLQSGAVEVSVFFKENESGTRRCSLRSKKHVDCAAIAHKFGGGGHRTAAGFRFEKSFSAIQKVVLEEIRQYIP